MGTSFYLIVVICILVYIAVLVTQKFLDNKFEESNLHEELGKLQSQLKGSESRLSQLTEENLELTKKFEKIRHQKISADVKMGQKIENVAPFMDGFKYKDDEIKGLFQPIDLIVFREDEIVFVEVKSGQSQLSDKQRKIKKLIECGKVRFETYRM